MGQYGPCGHRWGSSEQDDFNQNVCPVCGGALKSDSNGFKRCGSGYPINCVGCGESWHSSDSPATRIYCKNTGNHI